MESKHNETLVDWLTLKQAAHKLGVHPTTLRRWADAGEILVMLTPGGHRRFAMADVERFAEERRRLRTMPGLEQLWAEQALTQARREIVAHRGEHWLAIFDEQDREQKRQLGRRLMGLILRYVAVNEGGEILLEEARVIGRAHAENALGLGLSLVEALQAMLFFRDTMVEVAMQLPEVAHVRPEANQRLLRRINTLLNAVQLAIADAYEQARK
ncbi:MAG TPA: helix-turn-helix domain-containing protein [Anaerolineales bacterium]|nr:helix-turn-helix domain-containing protein [Anaerolineales bacterium]